MEEKVRKGLEEFFKKTSMPEEEVREKELYEILYPGELKELEKVIKEAKSKGLKPLDPEFVDMLRELFNKWKKSLLKRNIYPDYLAYYITYILSKMPSETWEDLFRIQMEKAKKLYGEVV